MKDHAEILRSYVPNGDGYNGEFAHDLSAAADEIERLHRVEQHCDTIRTAAANLIAYLDFGGDYREMLSKLKAALEEK